MSTPGLVDAFYSRIWNCGDLAGSASLLSRDFRFRGSLGSELRGYDAFGDYVRSVRGALADYHCEILDCVTEQNKAFDKMRFSGMHVAPLRGYQPTGTCTLARSGIISNRWRTHFRIVGLGRSRQSRCAP